MAMALPRIAMWRTTASMIPLLGARGFRSDAALDAIAKAHEEKVPNVVLYNYPSFSGAFSALFAHLFHSRLKLPCLILPFSSVVPFRVEDFFVEGLERCYLLDFLGPKGFVDKLLQRSMCEIIAFDHRKSVISQIPSPEDCLQKLTLHFDPEKSSSSAVYSYFSDKLANMISHDNKGEVTGLLNSEDQGRVEMILQYIEDIDLRKWRSPNSRAFSDGLAEWRSKLNCSTNQYMFEQLLGINSSELIAKGNVNISSCQNVASKLLDKAFKLRLGRGFYGECLGIRADGISNLSGEIGKQLSVKSVASGLRPIGAVVYMQRNNLKMCLRSTDSATDTSEIAKAYGGGGLPSTSSFIIRMDEFNQWLSVNACRSHKS